MELIWLVPAFPLAGFVLLGLGRRLPGRAAGIIGSATVGLSAVSACLVAWIFASGASGGSAPYSTSLWSWLELGSASPAIAFSVDALSVVMILVVTIVGFLIHLFSIEHMAGEEGYHRFFAYMNLFVAFMLILVLADNFLLLYLGWEGVGLCSFLLIGFWYRDRANGNAARKAFIVTRVGDVALLLGILLVAANLGSLGIGEASRRAATAWAPGSGIAVLAAALILGGALGKSAQLPLHTWLPDAMAGPSPVSALIHAATMVTAGVYLVARSNAFFSLAPQVLTAVAVLGAATLLVAGASALAQRDLKRILAYSTMSQIGYMFLALGVAAWTGGIFHLATHALFKSLLFLAAGAVINALGHERDVFAMGGVAKKMPLLFWTFLAGAFGLTALPPVTAGLASKDAIIARLWFVGGEARLLWWAAMAGVFLTSLYTFRMLFLVFAGESRGDRQEEAGLGSSHSSMGGAMGAATAIPLIILALLCLVGGLLDFPRFLGGSPFFGSFLGGALPPSPELDASEGMELLLSLAPLLLTLFGIPIAWLIARSGLAREAEVVAPATVAAARGSSGLAAFVRGGFGFDRLYSFLFVRPITRLAGGGVDPVNLASEGLRALTMRASRFLRLSQDGRPRRYLAVLALGAAILLAAVLI
ncbi:MAG: NADH-quinone oxidoreductase subunit L [Rectinemataceae bacterium]|jgi:NADH-quinone oxidoreductase subunit L